MDYFDDDTLLTYRAGRGFGKSHSMLQSAAQEPPMTDPTTFDAAREQERAINHLLPPTICRVRGCRHRTRACRRLRP